MAGVRFSNDGLTAWYGTADAPAPCGQVDAEQPLTVVLAASPPHPLNAATWRYAVDDGRYQSVVARPQRRTTSGNVEYFEALLPALQPGQTMTYEPTLTCGGRRAPAAGDEAAASSVIARAPREVGATGPEHNRPAVHAWWSEPRLTYSLEFLASIRVPLQQPEVIGETPDGIKVNWFWSPAEGEVIGPTLSARVRHIGGDWMTIRRDGIGIMDVRATLETIDGALLYVSYQGYYDLGPDGYHDFLAGRWPVRAPTRTSPRVSTADARYLWLNRTLCIGIGEVTISNGVTYRYDLYAVR
jgi:hypothetical protein